MENLSTKSYIMHLRPASEIGGEEGDIAFQIRRRKDYPAASYGLVMALDAEEVLAGEKYATQFFYTPKHFFVVGGKVIKFPNWMFSRARHMTAMRLRENAAKVCAKSQDIYLPPEMPALKKATNIFEDGELVDLLDYYWRPSKIREYVDECVDELTGGHEHMEKAFVRIKQGFEALLCSSEKCWHLDDATEEAVRDFADEGRTFGDELAYRTNAYFEDRVKKALEIVFLFNGKELDWSNV